MPKAFARLLPVLAVLAGLGLAQPALAAGGTADITTPAWANHDLPVYVGPGKQYPVRAVLPGGAHISVQRCSQLWCRISAHHAHGYVFLYSLSFGRGPNSFWWPPELRHPGVTWHWYVPSEPRF